MNLKSCKKVTCQQKQLLQASFLQGEDALNAWHEWKATADIESLDSESYCLLPLLYRNLSTNKVNDPLVIRLKSVYRRRWYENQLLFSKIIEIIHSFYNADIEALLLKDVALLTHYYPDRGTRVINNLEFLIHNSDVLKVVNILNELGWKFTGEVVDKDNYVGHSLSFVNNSNLKIKIHYPALLEKYQEEVESIYWKNKVLTKVSGIPIFILNFDMQVLSVCLHIATANNLLPIYELADAKVILDSHSDKINWKQLIRQAQERQLILLLKRILPELHQLLNIPISKKTLDQIQAISVPLSERIEHQIISCRSIPVFGNFLLKYFQHLRLTKDRGLKPQFLGFPKYLQYIWKLDNVWQIPVEVTTRGIKRVKMSVLKV